MTPPSSSRRDTAPWEAAAAASSDHRKELSPLNFQPINNTTPSNTQRTSPAPPPASSSLFLKEPQYGRNNRPRLPPSVFSNSFYDQEDFGAMSPGFHPLNNEDYLAETRRPSVASTSTLSSTGSKKSVGGMPGRFHKKLQGFFGEEYGNTDERQNSDTSLQQTPEVPRHGSQPERSGSLMDGRPSSRASSIAKPKEQGPSSEVTPWVFQDSDVSPTLFQCSLPIPDASDTMTFTMVVVSATARFTTHLHMHVLKHQYITSAVRVDRSFLHTLIEPLSRGSRSLINPISGCAKITI